MNRFDRYLGTIRSFEDFFEEIAGEGQRAPVYDIVSDGEITRLDLELPGVPKKDIAIDASGGVLTVSAEKKREDGVTDISSGRKFGKYRASFRLSDAVDTEAISARHVDGVLSVYLKKKEGTGPKKIVVE